MHHGIGIAFAALDAIGLDREVWGRQAVFHANDAIQIDDSHLELWIACAESDLSWTNGFMTSHYHTGEFVKFRDVHV